VTCLDRSWIRKRVSALWQRLDNKAKRWLMMTNY
jgi:hypothetical protein